VTDLQIDFDGNEVPIAESRPKPKRRGGQAGRARERHGGRQAALRGLGGGQGHDLRHVRPRGAQRGSTAVEAWLIEVKSTAGGPYERFGPKDRVSLKAEADRGGARPWLAWWPPRGKLIFIDSIGVAHMIPVHVALVDLSGKIARSDLQEVAGALNEQVQSDFAPEWHVKATVGAYDAVKDIPPATWTIMLREDIGEPGALGFHSDDHNQPFALVDSDAGDWTVTASHELLEMLADPWGNRLHTARVPEGVEPGNVGLTHHHVRVQYLVEVCDPPEMAFYEIGGVKVSDFLLKDWYRTQPRPSRAYSHMGYCQEPRQVAPQGYVSFAVGPEWWQVHNVGGQIKLSHLGRFDRQEFASLREFSDHHARLYQWK
jgi:hypothetical protein